MKAGEPAWRRLPSWYLVSADDRMINPDAERAMAVRMSATTTAIRGAGHASPVSHPVEVSKAIMAAGQVRAHP
jgi:pimeloyl-ACP methyl ester carboxylesterase